MIVIAIPGFVFRDESKHLLLFLWGLVFLAASAICGVAVTLALGRKLAPFPKPSATAELVQHGIYRLMRHPLYSAGLWAPGGWWLIRGSWLALVASLVLAVFFDAKAPQEEHWLRQLFPDYERYAQHVRRFIARIY